MGEQHQRGVIFLMIDDIGSWQFPRPEGLERPVGLLLVVWGPLRMAARETRAEQHRALEGREP